MLSVSFSLAIVATMLFRIMMPCCHTEVDVLNDPTLGPFPASLS